MSAANIPDGLIQPIADERQVVTEKVPHFLQFQPAAQVAALATGQWDEVISWRDFVCTHLGFASELVGFPAANMPFLVSVEDISAQRNWQPHRWDVSAFCGNINVAAQELPVPWVFKEHTTIRVVFENLGGLPAFPRLLLGGYLDVSPAVVGW